jgi:SAM-dependent methyltransferase
LSSPFWASTFSRKTSSVNTSTPIATRITPPPTWIAALYDSLGVGYTAFRLEDPRIAARVHAALGDARSVVNVGAGAGAYEPHDREVVAVEPSAVMVAQRPRGAAPVVRAPAESLPFADRSFDAAMAVLSDHHWDDHARALAELRRVASLRVVLFTWDPASVGDYLPSFASLVPEDYTLAQTIRRLGGARVEAVPLPHDCRDAFLHAYWGRPEAYLDARVRASISVFRLLPDGDAERCVADLRRDLDDGTWRRRNRDILEREELDLGYRLLVVDLDAGDV